MLKADNRKSRSRREICLKLTIKTSKKDRKNKHHSQQGHVHNTPEKYLDKVLDMLLVFDKKAQSLLLAFSRFHVLF